MIIRLICLFIYRYQHVHQWYSLLVLIVEAYMNTWMGLTNTQHRHKMYIHTRDETGVHQWYSLLVLIVEAYMNTWMGLTNTQHRHKMYIHTRDETGVHQWYSLLVLTVEAYMNTWMGLTNTQHRHKMYIHTRDETGVHVDIDAATAVESLRWAQGAARQDFHRYLHHQLRSQAEGQQLPQFLVEKGKCPS